MRKKKLPRLCFVLSPIGIAGSDIRRHADRVLDFIVTPACKTAGFKASRADKIESSGMITTEIINAIIDADVVVADLTGLNPNVFYELAVRHFTGRPFVQIVDKTTDIPFDVSNVRTWSYTLTEPESVSSCVETLTSLLEQCKSDESRVDNPVTAAMKSGDWAVMPKRPVSYAWDHATVLLNIMAKDIERGFSPEIIISMSGPGSFVACYVLSAWAREPILAIAQTFPVVNSERSLTATTRQLLVDSGCCLFETPKWDIALPSVVCHAPSGTRVVIMDDKVLSGTSQAVVRKHLTEEFGLDVRCAALTAPTQPVPGVLEWVGEVTTVRHLFPWGPSSGRHRPS